MPDGRAPLDPVSSSRGPSAELSANVRAAVARSAASKTSARQRLALALLGIPLAIVAGLVGSGLVFAGRPLLRVDLDTLPLQDLSERLAVLLLLSGIATGIALAKGRRGLGSKVTLLVATSLLVAPLYTLATGVGALRTPVGDAAAQKLHPLGLPCALVAFAVGVLALVAFGAALRRSVPVAPVLRSATLGAAAGGWAGLALFLQCPASEALHLLVGHALPVAAFVILGALALPRVLRL